MVANFAIVQKEVKRAVVRKGAHYNLDVIISVGYQVKSKRDIVFRKWGIKVPRDYAVEWFGNYDC